MSIFKAPLPMAGDEILCKFWHSEGWNHSKGSCPPRLRLLNSLWVFTDPYFMSTHTDTDLQSHSHPHTCVHMHAHTHMHMLVHTHVDTANNFTHSKSLSILVLYSRDNIYCENTKLYIFFAPQLCSFEAFYLQGWAGPYNSWEGVG